MFLVGGSIIHKMNYFLYGCNRNGKRENQNVNGNLETSFIEQMKSKFTVFVHNDL